MAEMKKGFDLTAALSSVSKLDTGGEGRKQIEYIDIDLIDPDPQNRKVDGIEELAKNISLVGLRQPLDVRPNPEAEGRYIAVSGHRRRLAIKMLVDSGEEKYRMTPCLVDREESPAMQRLKLLSGNIVTQSLTPAEMAQATKDLEDCLYQLQEEGYEFPGKIRDWVAKTYGIASSRVGRLKVIREKLIKELKKDWESGKLKESVAYVFAQQTPRVQQVMIQLITLSGSSNLDRKYWHESNVKYNAERAARELKPRKGPKGSCESCDATGLRLKRMAHGKWDDHCQDGKCCHCCPNIGVCEYACPHLSGEVEKAKKKAKAKRAQEKEEKAQENEKILAPRIRLWKRFGEARAAAGLTFEEYAQKAHVRAFRREKMVEDFEQGRKLTPSSGGLPYTGGDGLDECRIRPLIYAADALGCSVDYLLCRTDERGGGSQPVQVEAVGTQWLPPSQPPEEGQLVALKFDLGEVGVMYNVGRWKDGDWCFSGGTPMFTPPTGWFPLPGEEQGGADHD